MQINGFTNPFSSGLIASVRTNTVTEQSPEQGLETKSPVSVQGDSGRRVSASPETETPDSSSTSSDRQQTDVEQQIIQELAARDREVRQHEMAHQIAGGQYTGGATYTFERGPDGMMYAVGGEVSIDTSPVAGDPEATLQKAETIERAALAPANPSPQDLKVAAAARAMANDARAELMREQQDVLQSESGDDAIDAVSGDDTDAQALQSQESLDAREEREAQEAADRRNELEQAEEDRQARRDTIAEEQQERRERASEAMREFARDLAAIQEQLRELNKRLVETGAMQANSSLGGLLDRQV